MPEQITIVQRTDVGVATVMARKGVLASDIEPALELSLPTRPGFVRGQTLCALGSGPGVWLLMVDRPCADWAGMLQQRLSGLASVSDQTGAYVHFRLSGPDARRLLQAGAHIDLHPTVFGVGSAATTVIDHIGASLWQVDDAPTFDVGVFRSYADSFGEWLEQGRASLPYST